MVDADLVRALDLCAPMRDLRADARPKRRVAIDAALALDRGTDVENKSWTLVSELADGWLVQVGKPGKEATRAKPNPHDMSPVLFRGRNPAGFQPTFAELFGALESMTTTPGGIEGLDLLGHLLVRCAFMADHVFEDGIPEYRPPDSTVARIEELSPRVGWVPVRPFLQLLDAIAWNEDVKYGADKARLDDTGRPNTLLTLANFAAGALERVRWGEVAGSLASTRSGVAPIDSREALRVFPYLSGPLWVQRKDDLLLEQQVVRHLAALRGMSLDEIAAMTGNGPLNPKDKRKAWTCVRGSLAAVYGTALVDRLSSGDCSLKLATLRLDDRLEPCENRSIASANPAALETTWEESPLRRALEKRHIFAVFSDERDSAPKLQRVVGATIGTRDMGRAKKVWEQTRRAWVLDRPDQLPRRAAKGPSSVVFVNTRDSKGHRRREADGSERIETGRAFFLTDDYLLRMISRP